MDFTCDSCGAEYSRKSHYKGHLTTHKIQTTWKNIEFEYSTDPQNLVEYENQEIIREQEYAKKGIIYGSACFTDFDLGCDGLLEFFEQGFTVENALHQSAIDGYDLDGFGYILNTAELKAHHKIFHKNGWCCRHSCKECDNL